MVEKSVKIFSIRLVKLQQCIEGLRKDVVEDLLLDPSKDLLAEAPQYKLEAIRMVIDAIGEQVSDMKMIWHD